MAKLTFSSIFMVLLFGLPSLVENADPKLRAELDKLDSALGGLDSALGKEKEQYHKLRETKEGLENRDDKQISWFQLALGVAHKKLESWLDKQEWWWISVKGKKSWLETANDTQIRQKVSWLKSWLEVAQSWLVRLLAQNHKQITDLKSWLETADDTQISWLISELDKQLWIKIQQSAQNEGPEEQNIEQLKQNRGLVKKQDKLISWLISELDKQLAQNEKTLSEALRAQRGARQSWLETAGDEQIRQKVADFKSWLEIADDEQITDFKSWLDELIADFSHQITDLISELEIADDEQISELDGVLAQNDKQKCWWNKQKWWWIEQLKQRDWLVTDLKSAVDKQLQENQELESRALRRAAHKQLAEFEKTLSIH